jgi:serine/threonine protein kinase
MSEAFTLYVGAEVASALHHAHTRTDERGQPLGIIHRDVSPGRIYLRPNGAITLTDFALARSLLPGRVKTTVPHARGTPSTPHPKRSSSSRWMRARICSRSAWCSWRWPHGRSSMRLPPRAPPTWRST